MIIKKVSSVYFLINKLGRVYYKEMVGVKYLLNLNTR